MMGKFAAFEAFFGRRIGELENKIFPCSSAVEQSTVNLSNL